MRPWISPRPTAKTEQALLISNYLQPRPWVGLGHLKAARDLLDQALARARIAHEYLHAHPPPRQPRLAGRRVPASASAPTSATPSSRS